MTERKTWGNRIEFFLAILGYIVGFGNAVRFQYWMLESGRIVFIIVYMIFIVTLAIPLMIVESALGQYCKKSAQAVFAYVKIFQGMGISMTLLSLVFCIYYGLIMGWVGFFLIQSMQTELPWTKCNQTWVREAQKCFSYTRNYVKDTNYTDYRSSSQLYWSENILQLSSGIEDFGEINWYIALATLIGWIFMFLFLFRGVKCVGKVVIFTALGPYILLIVLLVRGLTLDGSWSGIAELFTPEWEKLLDFKVWTAAGNQVLFSVGPGWGGLITMASYNKFDSKIIRYSVGLCLACAGTSILMAITFFAWTGHLMKVTGVEPDKLFTNEGTALIFAAYPEMLAVVKGASAWSLVFFIFFLLVAVDSQLVTIETCIAIAIDEVKLFARHRKLFTLGFCVVGFWLSFTLTGGNGYYIYMLLDYYGSAFAVNLIVILECIFIYIIGYRRFFAMIDSMNLELNKLSKVVLSILIYFTAPVASIALAATCIVNFEPLTHYRDYVYPNEAIYCGYALAFSMLIPIVLGAVKALIEHRTNPRLAITVSDKFDECSVSHVDNDETDDKMLDLNNAAFEFGSGP